jgi:hypothetical protein
MPGFATTCVGQPDVPAGMTVAESRRSRPRRMPWWHRLLVRTVREAPDNDKKATSDHRECASRTRGRGAVSPALMAVIRGDSEQVQCQHYRLVIS